MRFLDDVNTERRELLKFKQTSTMIIEELKKSCYKKDKKINILKGKLAKFVNIEIELMQTRSKCKKVTIDNQFLNLKLKEQTNEIDNLNTKIESMKQYYNNMEEEKKRFAYTKIMDKYQHLNPIYKLIDDDSKDHKNKSCPDKNDRDNIDNNKKTTQLAPNEDNLIKIELITDQEENKESNKSKPLNMNAKKDNVIKIPSKKDKIDKEKQNKTKNNPKKLMNI